MEVLRLPMEESSRTQNLALEMGSPGADWPQVSPHSRDHLYPPPTTLRALEGLHPPLVLEDLANQQTPLP